MNRALAHILNVWQLKRPKEKTKSVPYRCDKEKICTRLNCRPVREVRHNGMPQLVRALRGSGIQHGNCTAGQGRSTQLRKKNGSGGCIRPVS